MASSSFMRGSQNSFSSHQHQHRSSSSSSSSSLLEAAFAPEREALLRDVENARAETERVVGKLKLMQMYIVERETGFNREIETLRHRTLQQSSTSTAKKHPPPPPPPQYTSTTPRAAIGVETELRTEIERLRSRVTGYEHTLSRLTNRRQSSSSSMGGGAESRGGGMSTPRSQTRISPRTNNKDEFGRTIHRQDDADADNEDAPTRTTSFHTPHTSRSQRGRRTASSLSSSVFSHTPTTTATTPTAMRLQVQEARAQAQYALGARDEAAALLSQVAAEARRNAALVRHFAQRLAKYEHVDEQQLLLPPLLHATTTAEGSVSSTLQNTNSKHDGRIGGEEEEEKEKDKDGMGETRAAERNSNIKPQQQQPQPQQHQTIHLSTTTTAAPPAVIHPPYGKHTSNGVITSTASALHGRIVTAAAAAAAATTANKPTTTPTTSTKSSTTSRPTRNVVSSISTVKTPFASTAAVTSASKPLISSSARKPTLIAGNSRVGTTSTPSTSSSRGKSTTATTTSGATPPIDPLTMARKLAAGEIDVDSIDESMRTTLLAQLQSMISRPESGGDGGDIDNNKKNKLMNDKKNGEDENDRSTVRVVSMTTRPRTETTTGASTTTINNSHTNVVGASATSASSVPFKLPSWLANVGMKEEGREDGKRLTSTTTSAALGAAGRPLSYPPPPPPTGTFSTSIRNDRIDRGEIRTFGPQ